MQKKKQNIYQKMSVYCLYCLSGFPSRLPQGEMSCCHGGKPTFFPPFFIFLFFIGPRHQKLLYKKTQHQILGLSKYTTKNQIPKKCPKEYKTLKNYTKRFLGFESFLFTPKIRVFLIKRLSTRSSINIDSRRSFYREPDSSFRF